MKKILLMFIIATVFISGIANAEVLIEDNFEDGNIGGEWNGADFSAASKYLVATDTSQNTINYTYPSNVTTRENLMINYSVYTDCGDYYSINFLFNGSIGHNHEITAGAGSDQYIKAQATMHTWGCTGATWYDMGIMKIGDFYRIFEDGVEIDTFNEDTEIDSWAAMNIYMHNSVDHRFDNLSISSLDNSINMTYPPENYVRYNGENVSFTTYVYGEDNLKNISLMINGTIVATKDTGDVGSFTANFGHVITQDGNVTWAIEACDENDICFYSPNRTTLRTVLYTFTNSLSPTCSVVSGAWTDGHEYTSGNSQTDTITCNLNGYQTYTETYNITDGYKNIDMTFEQLALQIFLYNGTLQDTTGYWADLNKTQNFSSNNLTLNVTDMLEGRVKIYFNSIGIPTNFTQFYEFDNDWSLGVTDNLTVIDTDNLNQVFIKIRDDAGNPINDALVRIAYSLPSSGGVFQELGQRYTGSDGVAGTTYFYINDDAEVSIRITKDGYTADTVITNIKHGDYVETAPLTVDLQRGTDVVYRGVVVRTYQRYATNMTTIPIFVYAPSRDNVQYYTSFKPNQNYTISLNTYKFGTATLTKGAQYCSGCTDDLVVHFYIDGVYYNNYTITYQGRDDTTIVAPTGLDNETFFRGVWLLLLFTVGIIGFIVKSEEESVGTGRIGKVLLMVGCFIVPIMFGGEFIFLMIISMFYVVGEVVRRWIGE